MISLFVGMPGTGKTTAMMDYVREHSALHRFFVIDRAGEWQTHEDGKPNPRWRGRPPNIINVSEGATWEWFDDQPSTGVFLFGHPWEGLDVASLCVQVGNTVYTDDEIDLVGIRQGWEGNPLRGIVHRGRHHPNARGEICELHLLGACRRPQNLHADLTAMCTQAFIYRCQGELTLNRLVADSWIEKDEWHTIRTLPNLNFKLWNAEENRSEYLIAKNPYGEH